MKPSVRVDFIQSLRALAAILVVVSHLAKEVVSRGVEDTFQVLSFLHTWQFGVDIFFIISGFIMFYVTDGKPTGTAPALSFVKKRAIRIIPLYWIYTTLFLASITLVPGKINFTEWNTPYLVASYSFIPWPRPNVGSLTPLLGLGWTLNYEMLFYAFFGVMIFVKSKRYLPVLMCAFGLAVIAGLFLHKDQPQLWYWTRSVILEFVLGAAIAKLFRSDRSFGLPWGIISIITGILIWQVSSALWPVAEPELNIRGFVWGPAAALIVGGFALCPPLRALLEKGGPRSIPQMLGDSSYSLYLSHMFVVRVMTILLGGLITGAMSAVYIFLTLTACAIVGYISYLVLEKPLVSRR